MDHLTTETLEKFINGEYQYPQMLEIAAHFMNCPDNCQARLNEIDPDFLKLAERVDAARRREALYGNHFSDDKIESYVTKRFDLKKRKRMNQHFTKCPVCSTKLKERDPDYLSSFIQDNINREIPAEYIVKSDKSGFNFKVLVPAAAFSLLLLAFLVSILIMLNNKPADQTKLDRSLPANLNIDEGNRNPTDTGNNNKRTTEVPLNSNNESKTQNINLKGAPSSKPIGSPVAQKSPKTDKSSQQQLTIVKSRSLNNNDEKHPQLALTPKDEIITETEPNLKWKPYPNAASYKIYLSDAQNILIEETSFSGEKTSYKISNKLELNKKYKWIVVVTLTDGKEVFGESAYFSVGEKAKKLPQSKNKSMVNQVRCLKSKN